MDVDYNELKKKVTQANRQIASIEKKYGDNAGMGAWGVRNLYDDIDNSVVNGISQLSGRVQIKKNMSPVQLKAIDKAVTKFINNKKTSTLKGINETKKAVRDGIKKSLSNPNPDYNRGNITISDKDAETLYSFLEDKTLRSTMEKLNPSTVWNYLMNAKEHQEQGDEFGLSDFLRDVQNHSEVMPDKDMLEDLEIIYNRYFT